MSVTLGRSLRSTRTQLRLREGGSPGGLAPSGRCWALSVEAPQPPTHRQVIGKRCAEGTQLLAGLSRQRKPGFDEMPLNATGGAVSLLHPLPH